MTANPLTKKFTFFDQSKRLLIILNSYLLAFNLLVLIFGQSQ